MSSVGQVDSVYTIDGQSAAQFQTIHEVEGRASLPLTRVFGVEGLMLLRDTLAEIARKQGSFEGDAARHLDWEAVPNAEHRYRTAIDGTRIELRLDGPLAELAYTTMQPSAVVNETVRIAVNRKVNHLLAYAAARQLAQRLDQYVAVRARVKQSVAVRQQQHVAQRATVGYLNSSTIRTSAYFGSR